MTTSAGRFKSTTSKGSKRRSIVLLRPMAMPSTVPRTIASAKDAATRARVTARAKRSLPERASAPMTESTASGDGKARAPAIGDSHCHRSSKRASGINRSNKSLVFPGRQTGAGLIAFIISFLIKFLCGAGEVLTPALGENAIEHPCVGNFLLQWPPRNAIGIGLPVKGELTCVTDSGFPADILPVRV